MLFIGQQLTIVRREIGHQGHVQEILSKISRRNWKEWNVTEKILRIK